jgi:class 3 adenylate cyclase
VEKERVQRRLAAILAADVAGYSRLTGADEEGTIARLRVLRRELIEPVTAAHRGRIVKTTGDGILIEFPSVVEAVRCAVEVQRGMTSRNVEVPTERRIEFRVGIHLGDVVVEGDDLLGDGVNVAVRLEGLAEPNGICVSAAVHDQVRDKLPLSFTDLGDRELKHIARPTRVFSFVPDEEPMKVTPTSGAVALRSIVVLPFRNLSGNSQYDAFADALTENLTTDLSRKPERFVIAKNTAFTYKGKSVSVTLLGKELGVRHVIEGAVQYGDGRVRINVQMIDAATGAHIWADRFDKSQGDSLDMQEEITSHIARAVDVRLREVEGRHANQVKADGSDATNLAMQAWTRWFHGPSKESCLAALQLFEEAATQDDHNVFVLAGLCNLRAISVISGWSTTPDEDVKYVGDVAARAFSLNPNHPYVYLARGYALLLQQKPTAAILAFERLVELDPTGGSAYAILGIAKICAGRFRDGIGDLHCAIRLSPRDPIIAEYYGFLGMGYVCIGEPDNAITWLEKSVNLNPNMDYSHIWLASAYAEANRLVEARQAVAALRALQSDWSLRKLLSIAARISLSIPEHAIAALRTAGVPDE